MRVDSQRLDICYNVQTSVDAKKHLIVDYDVINNSTDHHQLVNDAKAAKNTLGVERLEVTTDKGFYVMKDLKDCEQEGVTVFMSIPATVNPHKRFGVPEPEFYTDRFVYDAVRDVYVCPAGEELGFWKCIHKDSSERGRVYKTVCCALCGFRSRCTRNKCGRIIFRGGFEDSVERLRSRLGTSEGKERLKLRREIVEHPFGTMKRAFNRGYLLLKGFRKVKGKVGFTMLAYNMRRVINIFGVGTIINLMKK